MRHIRDFGGDPHKMTIFSEPAGDRSYSPFVARRTAAADSDIVCPAICLDRDLVRWMSVFGYEIDFGDAPGVAFEPAGHPNGSYHVASLVPDAHPWS